MKYWMILLLCVLFVSPAMAKHASDHPLTDDDWKEVMDKIVLLEDAGLMPTVLPTVLRNRDMLQLTTDQIRMFRAWRKQNYVGMVNLMNKIIEKTVEFKSASLSPRVSKQRLLAFQGEIRDLQRQLLKIKLSCREIMMSTFTDEQWENFAFVVADDPRLGSLLSLSEME